VTTIAIQISILQSMASLVKKDIANQISAGIEAKKNLLSEPYLNLIAKIAKIIITAYKQGNKILLCGNGGSASDVQHIEGELVGRFKKERKPLPAIALTANTSTITAIGNDYGYNDIFKRGIEAYGNTGDALIAVSTSGNSKNVILAAKQAKKQKLTVIALLGGSGGKLKELADIAFIVPSSDTPRIQECHILIGHILCDLIEKGVFDE